MEAVTPLIYSAITKVMNDIGSIGKSRKNLQQNYSFRGIDDMYNAIHPALVSHGVFCAPTVLERSREEKAAKNGGVLIYTTLTVKHTFYASDGSSIDVVTVGEAMDSGDKSSNKAMSAAMKYALIELFCIPTDGDNDTENHSHDLAQKQVDVAKEVLGAKEAPKKGCISEKQRNRLFAIAKSSGVSPATMKTFLLNNYGLNDSSEIKWQDYKDICDWVESQKSKGDAFEDDVPFPEAL